MNAAEIYQALRKHGYNASKVAEALEVRPQSVATVIRDGCGSERIARAVAVAAKLPFEQAFPFYAKKKARKYQRSQQIKSLKAMLEVA